ncbi:MAG: L,D-transpeptidase family protein [Pseudomonadota bacterium]|nr:L,D-transpeptidase family protein [Pseudomonadota bacterium]
MGSLEVSGRAIACALGRTGLTGDKREGDGATPLGSFPLRRVLYRSDRCAPLTTSLPIAPIAPDAGWCDSPSDPAYNRYVWLPYGASAERLWRDDHLYDVVVVLGHNDDPVMPGRGSAIFFHLAAPDFAPTAGCIAIAADAMREVLGRCGPTTVLTVRAE